MQGLKGLLDKCYQDIKRITTEDSGLDSGQRFSKCKPFTTDDVLEFVIMTILLEDVNRSIFPAEVIDKNKITIAVKDFAEQLRPFIPNKKKIERYKVQGQEFFIPIPDCSKDFEGLKSSIKKIVYNESR